MGLALFGRGSIRDWRGLRVCRWRGSGFELIDAIVLRNHRHMRASSTSYVSIRWQDGDSWQVVGVCVCYGDWGEPPAPGLAGRLSVSDATVTITIFPVRAEF